MASFSLARRAALPGLGRKATSGGSAGVFVSERSNLALATVAARRNATGTLVRRVQDVFGFEPALEPRHVGGNGVGFVWSAPAQWLAVGDGISGGAFVARLRTELSSLASVSDQTDGLVVIRLRGPDVRRLLAKGLPIDLHPRTFAPGHAAVTALGQVRLHIWQVDDQPSYDLAVPTSYISYVWRWIVAAAAQFGLSAESDGSTLVV